MNKIVLAGIAVVVGISAIAYSHAASLSSVQAKRAQDFLDGFGVNTHFDFNAYGYQNIAQTIQDINYLGGVKLLRDSPGNDADLTTWPEIAAGTGATFDAYIGEGAPTIYATELARMEAMRHAGAYVSMFEGGNEEDDVYPVGLGNSQKMAAQFQSTLYASAHKDHVSAINISFGAGWCDAQNDPTCAHGDYNTVGNLSASADFANAHSYTQQSPQSNDSFANLNADANMAAPGKPVAITEFGWTTYPSGVPSTGWGNVSSAVQADYVLEGMFDAFELGDPYYFYYGLYDDGSGHFGLFSTSGQPKASATAVHNLFALLSDAGENAKAFSPASLSYSLTGLPAQTNGEGGHQILLQKSDGSFWLAVWNEQPLNSVPDNRDIAPGSVAATLTLQSPASVAIYDPTVSTVPQQSAAAVSTISLQVPAHPILIEIQPVGGSARASSSTATQAGSQTPEAGVVTVSPLRVHSAASLTAPVIGVETAGSTGALIGQDQVADGYAWAHVQYQNGIVGWSAKQFLRLISPLISTTQTQTQTQSQSRSQPSASSAPSPVAAQQSPSPISQDVQPATPSTPEPAPVSNQSAQPTPRPIPPVDTPQISAPASLAASAGQQTAVPGISVADPFGAVNPGTLAFDASAMHGSVYLAGAKGSGSQFLIYAGTLDQINQAAKELSYVPQAGATSDTIAITVYNQAGVYATKTIAVSAE